MKPAWRLGVCTLPGLAVAGTALLAGLSPAVRDIPSYFLPLRHHVGEVVRGRASPFWNPRVGCGEAVWANPQLGVLYPPAWLAAVLPAERALGAEVGLHLALLGLGCGLLTRRLGGRDWLDVAAAWGAVLAGPVVDAAGVLNNLDTLAWTPWLWWAALGRRAWPVALLAALGWLGAEPWLAAVAAVGALVLAPNRRTLGALALAGGLVAAQALPFVAWAREGDRGLGIAPEAAARGAVTVRELVGLAVPNLPLPPRGDRFVAHLTMPFWALLMGGLALAGRGPGRRLAAVGWTAVALSVLPGLPGVRVGWAWLTRGLVWYPGRMLFVAVVALLPAAAAQVGGAGRRWRLAAGAAVLALVGGLVAGGTALELAVQTGCAVATLGGPVPVLAALLASASQAPGYLMALDLTDLKPPALDPCLRQPAAPAGRWLSLPLTREQLVWVQEEPLLRGRALGWGYWGLWDDRPMARSYAPVQSRRLAAHLAEADRGAAFRWWLDSLAAPWLVGHRAVPLLPRRCRTPAGTVLHNPAAWPEAWVVEGMPGPDQRPIVCGRAEQQATSGHVGRWRCRVDRPRAMLLLSRTPDPGWRYRVDGTRVPITPGPGILQGVAVPQGEHLVEAVYSPPGLLVGLGVSLLSWLALAGGIWRRW